MIVKMCSALHYKVKSGEDLKWHDYSPGFSLLFISLWDPNPTYGIQNTIMCHVLMLVVEPGTTCQRQK